MSALGEIDVIFAEIITALIRLFSDVITSVIILEKVVTIESDRPKPSSL